MCKNISAKNILESNIIKTQNSLWNATYWRLRNYCFYFYFNLL